MNLLDRLQASRPNPLRAGRPRPDELPGTWRGFDVTRVTTHDSADFTATANIGRFVPVLVLDPETNVSRVRIERLGVQGRPEGKFLARYWWSLQSIEGPIQELELDSRYDTRAVASTIRPIVTGGRFAPFGSIAQPATVTVEVHQAARIQLVLFTEATQYEPITTYVRMAGAIHYRGGIEV